MTRIGHPFKRLENASENLLGGKRRLQVIVMLAAVLGLDGADKGTIGAIAGELQQAMNLSSIQIGLLVTATTLTTAIATLPIGVLVDRMNRKRVLIAGIIVWSSAMVVSGFATSYLFLLITRIALGIGLATVFPAIASMTGDFFPAYERGRIWGYLLAGELVGTALGFLIAGALVGFFSWRAALFAMGGLGFILAPLVAHVIVEPERGGHARLPPHPDYMHSNENDKGTAKPGLADEIQGHDIKPLPERVITTDPGEWSFWYAAKYILTMRTNIILIVASALGYFYFTGMRTFAVVYMQKQFGLAAFVATIVLVGIGIGAILGVLLSGRLADHLIARDHINARISVAIGAFLLTAGFLLPGLLVPTLAATLAFFFLAAIALGSTNPPLDAARLDIMHSRLWGRAESIRITLRYLFEAAAPVTFGLIASFFDSSTQPGKPAMASAAQHSATGLKYALLAMLVVMVAAGLILLAARRTYPRDVATALRSQRRTDNG